MVDLIDFGDVEAYEKRAPLLLSTLAATALLLATACKKSNNDVAPSAAFSATIHDTAWQATYANAVYYQGVGTYALGDSFS